MLIPDPFTPAAITAGIITNLASTIVLHCVQGLEDTLVGRLLKKAKLIEPNFDERLREILIKTLELFFKEHPEYELTGIEIFFCDPIVAQQIGNYILDGQLPKQDQINQKIDQYLGTDGITRALIHKRGLVPDRIIPGFFKCYRQVLRRQLSIPQMAIMLEVIEQTKTIVAELQSSEERITSFISKSLGGTKLPEHKVIHVDRPKDYLPFLHNPLFQPRPGEFEKLEALLFDRKDHAPTRLGLVGMLGMGGIGKTQLAVELAYRYKDRFPDGIFWVTATGKNLYDWQHHLAELAGRINYLPPNDEITHPENELRRASYLCRYFASHRGTLLILDNIEEPSLIFSALPILAGGELSCTILYTSRRTQELPNVVTYDVKLLPEKVALQLLLKDIRPKLLSSVLAGSKSAEAKSARDLCKKVGYLPLGLIHLRGYLAQDKRVTLIRLAQVLEERGAIELTKDRYLDAVPLFATFWLSWEKVKDEAARDLFQLAAYFPEASPIPLWILGLAVGLGETNDIFEPLGKTRLLLQEVSLLEELSDDQVRLHPLIREFSRSLTIEDSDRGEKMLEEAARKIVIEFQDLNRLEQRAQHVGYWQCLEQIRAARVYLELLDSKKAVYLKLLEHWMDLESHILGSVEWSPDILPGLFYQQLYNRAVEESQPFFESKKAPAQWIKLLAPVGAEDHALIRVLAHGMRNEVLASKQKNERYVPLTCRRDDGKRGRKQRKEQRISDLVWQKVWSMGYWV